MGSSRNETMQPEYRNILIIKPGALGDLLQMTPVFRHLRQYCPAAKITLMVGSDMTADLFRHSPLVDEVVVYDRWKRHRTWRPLLALRRELARKPFDLVINFQRSNLRGWVLASAAFPCRVLIYHKSRQRSVHAVENHLATLRPLGFPLDEEPLLEMSLGQEDEEFADRIFRDSRLAGKTVVALNPGASTPDKCWPTELFGRLGDLLLGDPHVAVLLVGAPHERPLADEILAFMGAEPVDCVGETTPRQLGAVLKRCSVVVSGDTGPLHMATAVGTPVVGLFGPTDPARTGPVGPGHVVLRHPEVECVPCRSARCRKGETVCMRAITPEEVAASVHRLLLRGSGEGAA